MRLATLILCLASAPLAFAQAGSPDPDFGTDGIVRLASAPSSGALDIVEQTGGRVLVAGAEGGDAVLYGLDATGALDPTFGTGGVVRISDDNAERAAAIVIQPSGRIVLAVDRLDPGAVERAALVGLTPDGALDTSFGKSGTVYVRRARWSDLALAPDGRMVGLLTEDLGSETVSVALRFSAEGAPDASFGDGGATTFFVSDQRPQPEPSRMSGLAVDAAGRVIAVGVVARELVGVDPVVARLTADGAVDDTFGMGIGGNTRIELNGAFSALLGVALAPDGRIVATGTESSGDVGVVVRLIASGALDADFGTGGIARVSAGTPETELSAVVVQPNGKPVVVGSASGTGMTWIVASRLRTNGSRDPSFGSNGLTRLESSASDDERAVAVALAADGDVLLAGLRETADGGDRSVVARLLNDIVVSTDPDAADGFALIHAGPNPSASGRVALRLSTSLSVRLNVYDVLGRAVGVLHDGLLAAGSHRFDLGHDLAPGVYLVRATTADGAAAMLSATVAR